jgi:hypothetical protein
MNSLERRQTVRQTVAVENHSHCPKKVALAFWLLLLLAAVAVAVEAPTMALESQAHCSKKAVPFWLLEAA